MSAHQFLQPEGWPPPHGYANGVLAEGRTLWLAGQVGWDQRNRFPPDLPGQVEQALRNTTAVLAAAGAKPEHVVRMTWYMVDVVDYQRKLHEIGEAYRRVMGRHYPAMSVVQVARLVEREALVEIEMTAVLPPGRQK
jgi:enamine deaminase RidA (YjgF/YER057c/UK114 family)